MGILRKKQPEPQPQQPPTVVVQVQQPQQPVPVKPYKRRILSRVFEKPETAEARRKIRFAKLRRKYGVEAEEETDVQRMAREAEKLADTLEQARKAERKFDE